MKDFFKSPMSGWKSAYIVLTLLGMFFSAVWVLTTRDVSNWWLFAVPPITIVETFIKLAIIRGIWIVVKHTSIFLYNVACWSASKVLS